MKYYKCYLTEEEVRDLEAAAGQCNMEYGMDCLEGLPVKEVTKEEYNAFWGFEVAK